MNPNRKFLALAGLTLATAPTLMASAIAAPTGFMIHKDSKGAVYFGGANNGTVTVMVGNLPQTKNLKVNACGIATIRPSTTRPVPASFLVGTSSITPASLPTQLLPKCNTTTGALEESRTANFKTAEGAVVLVGLTPNGSAVMTYTGEKERTVKLNACGFGRINNSTTKPFATNTTFTPAGGSALTYSAIPTKSPFLCKNDVTYSPQ